jgi:2-haloacid dehalogenase
MAQPWITFDCFGTLVDWHSGFRNLVRPIAGERTPDLLAAYHRFEPKLEGARPHLSYKSVVTGAMRLAAEETGLRFSDRDADAILQDWSSMPLFDDVESELAALRASGSKLAVLTNCDEDLFEQTHRRFRQRFDLVVTAERVQDYKPALAHFRYFSRVSGVDHREWVHVACSWFHDIAPARELGLSRIWIDRDSTGDDACAASHRLTSMKGLAETVDRLVTQ